MTTTQESTHATQHLTGKEMIPDVVKRWPSARAVLDRYGLHCCGGPHGPAETLSYFARAHDVDQGKLLRELEEAIALGLPTTEPAKDDPAGSIYRRFFLAGIAATLTAGATWGAWLLLRLGFAGSFRELGTFEVNAHGHAQIFGWVGLFVMGFAYQAFPRFKHGSLRRPRLALATFPIYVVGLILRTVGEALQPSPVLLAAGLAGSVLEIAAILIFAWMITETLFAPGAKRSASDHYILSAIFWFVAQAIYDAFFFPVTSLASTVDELVQSVGTWQVPLRDMQIHGFATLMILGVSQRYLPGMLGLCRVPEKLANRLLLVFNLAVAGEIVGFLGKRLWGGPVFVSLLEGSTLAFGGSCVVLALRLGVLHRHGEPDRSLKFVRAAYAWLMVSLLLLAAMPLYAQAFGGFSHAYFGATRHAITVGFISLMIVGVASKVVPTLNGVPATALPGLWAPFLLINAGCFLRVLFQTLTDFTPVAFPVAGLSGLFEVVGLTIWSAHILRVLAGRYRFAVEGPIVGGAPVQALPEHNVGWLVRAAPQTIPVFERMGFPLIRNHLLRETVANSVNIRQACRLRGVDEEKLLRALDEILCAPQPRPTAVPVTFVGRIREGECEKHDCESGPLGPAPRQVQPISSPLHELSHGS